VKISGDHFGTGRRFGLVWWISFFSRKWVNFD
jgi:hypothetical protein